jgi:hypothetical protein
MPRGRNIFPQSAKGAKLVSVGPGKSAANFLPQNAKVAPEKS